MTTEIKHIKVDKDTRIEPILEAAGNSPVILEFGDAAYRLNPVGETSSPFTVETAYASVRTVDARGGEDISAEELDELIEDARRRYAQGLVDGMYSFDRKLDNVPGSARVSPSSRRGA